MASTIKVENHSNISTDRWLVQRMSSRMRFVHRARLGSSILLRFSISNPTRRPHLPLLGTFSNAHVMRWPYTECFTIAYTESLTPYCPDDEEAETLWASHPEFLLRPTYALLTPDLRHGTRGKPEKLRPTGWNKAQ